MSPPKNRSPVMSLDEARDRAMREAPEAFGDGFEIGRAPHLRRALGPQRKPGLLLDDQEPDVAKEMERSLEWATRDVPEEENT